MTVDGRLVAPSEEGQLPSLIVSVTRCKIAKAVVKPAVVKNLFEYVRHICTAILKARRRRLVKIINKNVMNSVNIKMAIVVVVFFLVDIFYK